MASETVFFSADLAHPVCNFVLGSEQRRTAHARQFVGVFGDKIIDVDRCEIVRERERLPRMLRAMVELRHKHVVWSFAWLQVGRELQIVSQHHEPLDRCTAPRRSLHHIVSGLAYLHAQDIVHRRLSLDNLVVDDTHRVLIRGCGIACVRESLAPDPVAKDRGTFFCAASPRWTDKSLDVYSFGVVALCLWKLTVPIPCDNAKAQACGNTCMERMIRSCISTDPGERPKMDEILADFKAQPAEFMV